MTRALLLAAGLVLAISPAWSQSSSRSDDRGSFFERRDRDGSDWSREGGGWSRDSGGWHDRMDDDRPGRHGRGGRFMVRSGDSAVAVRCDPSESMKACLDATLTLLDRARASAPTSGTGSGSGTSQPPR